MAKRVSNKKVKQMMVDVALNFKPFCIHERIHEFKYLFHKHYGLKVVGGSVVNYGIVSLTANKLKGIKND